MTREQLISLAQERPPTGFEIYQQNEFYGNAHILKKFVSYPERYAIKACIEHGVADSKRVYKSDLSSPLPSLLVPSSRRIPIVQAYTDKHIYSIGPIIAYAEPISGETQKQYDIRKKGKTLLLFPGHSTRYIDVRFDTKKLIHQIKQQANDFTHITVVMYWKDVLDKAYEPYLDEGWECVTAGYIHNPDFLPLLKAILQTGDALITNEVGTQIGLGIMHELPTSMIQMDLNYSSPKKDFEHTVNLAREKSYDELLIIQAFGKDLSEITTRQRELVQDYWGLSDLKSKDALQNIFETSDILFARSKLKLKFSAHDSKTHYIPPDDETLLLRLYARISKHLFISPQQLQYLYQLIKTTQHTDGDFIDYRKQDETKTALIAALITGYHSQKRTLYYYRFTTPDKITALTQLFLSEMKACGFDLANENHIHLLPFNEIKHIEPKLSCISGIFINAGNDQITRQLFDFVEDKHHADTKILLQDVALNNASLKALQEIEQKQQFCYQLETIDLKTASFKPQQKHFQDKSIDQEIIQDFLEDHPSTLGISSSLTNNQLFSIYYIIRKLYSNEDPESTLPLFLEYGLKDVACQALMLTTYKRRFKYTKGYGLSIHASPQIRQFFENAKPILQFYQYKSQYGSVVLKREFASMNHSPTLLFFNEESHPETAKQDLETLYPLLKKKNLLLFAETQHSPSSAMLHNLLKETKANPLEIPILYPSLQKTEGTRISAYIKEGEVL